jgi:hypothetical protein
MVRSGRDASLLTLRSSSAATQPSQDRIQRKTVNNLPDTPIEGDADEDLLSEIGALVPMNLPVVVPASNVAQSTPPGIDDDNDNENKNYTRLRGRIPLEQATSRGRSWHEHAHQEQNLRSHPTLPPLPRTSDLG